MTLWLESSMCVGTGMGVNVYVRSACQGLAQAAGDAAGESSGGFHAAVDHMLAMVVQVRTSFGSEVCTRVCTSLEVLVNLAPGVVSVVEACMGVLAALVSRVSVSVGASVLVRVGVAEKALRLSVEVSVSLDMRVRIRVSRSSESE